jgi:hypothetical protein
LFSLAQGEVTVVRDGLLRSGQLLNVVKKEGIEVAIEEVPERKASRLYLADDPAVRHLRPEPGAAAAQADLGP